jgi:uncharacterized protein
MAREFLIIDGYNLMHAAGMARPNYGPGDLERCRNRLLRFLKSVLSAEARRRTTIVFDAWEPPPGRLSVYTVAGMTVQFAEAPGEADAAIEQLIAAHSAPKQVTVISGDRRLQQAASRRKSRFIDSEAWYTRWEHRQPPEETPPSPSPKQDPDLSDQEVDYWLNIFGDIENTATTENGPTKSSRKDHDGSESDLKNDDRRGDDLDDDPMDDPQQGLPDIIDEDFLD